MIERLRPHAAKIIIAGIILITTLEWNFAEWYAVFTPYGTLITFTVFVLTSISCLDIKATIKDPVFWLMVGTAAFALLNLFIIHSNKGCILVILNTCASLYLMNKISFTKIEKYVVLGLLAFYFFYWTIDVKGYFKGYNTNYGGLILITGFACLMVLSEFFTTYLRENPKKWGWVYIPVEIFFIVVAFRIIAWYRSRTALIGLIVLLALKFIPIGIIKNKAVYILLTLIATVGGVLTSLAYIGLGKLKEYINLQLFYKDLISGREVLWKELWGAFIKSPITGIGSSYQVKTDFMFGMLEVHNGMLDILIIHGIIVFIPICLLLTKRILERKEAVCDNRINKMIFAAIICMMVTSYFENYIIVQPFSLALFSLLSMLNGTQENSNC